MKHVFKAFAALSMVLFLSASVNAQTATTVSKTEEAKTCDIKKCDPALCDAMVKAGLCTKDEAEKCKAKCAAAKGTKVAAASVERDQAATVSNAKVATKKTSCTPAQKKACQKICSKKNTEGTDL